MNKGLKRGVGVSELLPSARALNGVAPSNGLFLILSNLVDGGVYWGNSVRLQKRVYAASAPGATPMAAVSTDSYDVIHLTGLAAAITSMTPATSTPLDGDTLRVSFTDNGTARAITWGASYESSGSVVLPATTILGVRLDVNFVWNTETSKWRCVGAA